MRKIDTVEVANYLMERMGKDSATAELIHPDELVAGIISQVSAEPDMGQLLAGLVYSQDGRPKPSIIAIISFSQLEFGRVHYLTFACDSISPNPPFVLLKNLW